MKNKKCTRCGKCCVSAPCFYIGFGDEVMIEMNERKIHKCPYLSFSGKIAKCDMLCKNQNHLTGKCSSGAKYDFTGKEMLEIYSLFKKI